MKTGAEYRQPSAEQIHESLREALVGLATEFHLDETKLQERLEAVLAASETGVEVEERHWKEMYQRVKAAAQEKPDTLEKLKRFLQTKGYSAFTPLNGEDRTDVIIKKLHTHLFDRGTGTLSRDAQAEIYYFVIGNMFGVE